ncbi:hypothetical protein [Bifidobacterium sp.]|uniref:hypothetical protein n=1 Tax=Bifidobacterium sp. TaxID=41200 RepID=UPI00386D3C5D
MASNPYANVVEVNGSIIIDLRSDTVAASHLESGYTAHDASGAPVAGSLSFVTYHVSSSEPTSSDGSDGDIWLVTE